MDISTIAEAVDDALTWLSDNATFLFDGVILTMVIDRLTQSATRTGKVTP